MQDARNKQRERAWEKKGRQGWGGGRRMHVGENEMEKMTDENKAFCQGNARRDEGMILGGGSCLKSLG